MHGLLEFARGDQLLDFPGGVEPYAKKFCAVGVLILGAPAISRPENIGIIVSDRRRGGHRDQVLPLVGGVAGLLLELALRGLERVLPVRLRFLFGDVLRRAPGLDPAGDKLGRHLADAVPELVDADKLTLLVGSHDDDVIAAAEVIVGIEGRAVRKTILQAAKVDPFVLYDVLDADLLPLEVCVLFCKIQFSFVLIVHL